MGRTLPTIIQALHTEQDAWSLYRRSLRKEDQEAFDALWRCARRHAAPSSMASRPAPLDAVFMSMLVGLARRLMDLEGRMEASAKESANGRDNTEGPGLAL
jgi:hypothetical protein